MRQQSNKYTSYNGVCFTGQNLQRFMQQGFLGIQKDMEYMAAIVQRSKIL